MDRKKSGFNLKLSQIILGREKGGKELQVILGIECGNSEIHCVRKLSIKQETKQQVLNDSELISAKKLHSS